MREGCKRGSRNDAREMQVDGSRKSGTPRRWDCNSRKQPRELNGKERRLAVLTARAEPKGENSRSESTSTGPAGESKGDGTNKEAPHRIDEGL